MKKLILLVVFLLTCLASWAQKTQTLKPEKKVENGEMKTYYLVFLKKGTKRDQDSITSAKIQEGHMAHLNKMYAEGKFVLVSLRKALLNEINQYLFREELFGLHLKIKNKLIKVWLIISGGLTNVEKSTKA